MQTLRHVEILERARRDGRVAVEDLATTLGVTVQTIRRDLADLAEAGLLSRVHGGAILGTGVTNIGYAERRTLNAAAKDRIAAACAAEVPRHASVFLNIGTTTEAVARHLANHDGLMVVTNNLHVATTLGGSRARDVIVTGGLLRAADGGLVGPTAAAAVQDFKVDIAIIGASALDSDGDLLDFDQREVAVSRTVIAAARQTWLVADASKFGRAAPIRIASLGALDRFFTDAPPPGPVRLRCDQRGTEIVTAAD